MGNGDSGAQADEEVGGGSVAEAEGVLGGVAAEVTGVTWGSVAKASEPKVGGGSEAEAEGVPGGVVPEVTGVDGGSVTESGWLFLEEVMALAGGSPVEAELVIPDFELDKVVNSYNILDNLDSIEDLPYLLEVLPADAVQPENENGVNEEVPPFETVRTEESEVSPADAVQPENENGVNEEVPPFETVRTEESEVPPADVVQPENDNEVNEDVTHSESDIVRTEESEVPPADAVQPENENEVNEEVPHSGIVRTEESEVDRARTNQPNPENDTLHGSSLSQGINNDTLHGSSMSQEGDNDTLHGSSIPQGGDNDTLRGSSMPKGADQPAARFKLMVPRAAYQGHSALENSQVHGFAIANDLREAINTNQGWATENQVLGLLQNSQIYQLAENDIVDDTEQGAVVIVSQNHLGAFPITREYTSSRRILKEHGPFKLKVSGVTINKFVVKGNLWSRMRYTIDNTCHMIEWSAKQVVAPRRTRGRTTEDLIASNTAVIASHTRVLESNASVVESNNRLVAAVNHLIARLGESSRP